jgi:membrane protein YfhO
MRFVRLIREGIDRKVDWIAILFITALPLVYNWPAVLRQAVFSFGDIFLFFYPTHLVYASVIRQFRLPLWAPEMLSGFPLYAEGQIGALYPIHPILYGLLPIDIATNYDILFHLSWVAVGTFLFARSLKLHTASAVLAAVAFGWGGFFTPRYQHMSVLATASWLPWILWAWEKHEQENDKARRLRWFVLLTLMSAIQLLAGHPQFAFLTAILVSMYATVNWKRSGTAALPPSREKAFWRRVFFEYFDLRAVVPVVLFFGLGAMIASVQLIPTFELGNFSSRASGLLPKFFNAFSLRAIHFALLVHPFLLGNPYPGVSVEVMGYVGLLVLLFALGAILVRRDRRVVFLLLVAALALFLGLGDQNVFYRGLRYLPLFSYFRVASRFFYWYTFAAAMLAAITFDYFISRAKETTRLTFLRGATICIFAITSVMIAVLVYYLPIETWLSIWAWFPLALLLVAVWIILGARRSLFERATLNTLVLGVTVIDLMLFASVYSKTYDVMTPTGDFYRPPDSLSVIKDVSAQGNRALTSLWIYPVMSTMRESLYPNISMIYGVPNAIGYTPLIFERSGLYLEKMSASMMNLLNARYYLLPQMLPTTPQVEGDDLENDYMIKFMKEYIKIPPISVSKILISSSLAQSVNLKDGTPVAQISLVSQDGASKDLLLRAGLDTAEWAYERSDVQSAIKHSMPLIATTYSASSAFPVQIHPGHTFLAQYDIADQGAPITLSGIHVTPLIDSGLIHIERFDLVMADGSQVPLAHLVGRDDQHLIYRSQYVAIYENPDSLPRAFLVHATQILSDDSAREQMLNDQFDPRRSLLLASGDKIFAADGSQRDDESVKITEYQPERIVIDVHLSEDGYLLLTDSWYPGWVALVDGAEKPIERADYIFRAVRASPGDHRIELEYRPLSFYMGAAIGLGGLGILGAVFVSSRRKY